VTEAHLVGTFAQRAERQLEVHQLPQVLGAATDRLSVTRDAAFEGVDRQAMRVAGEAIRAHTVVNLDRYLERFASQAEARGIRVFFAADAADAVAYVRDVARRRGARLIAKGKSMISEEIELNPALEADGVRVVETDLGEYIVQVAHEPPSHIIVPAVHKTRGDIAELFTRAHDLTSPLPDDPERLTAFARAILRETFVGADIGITGVNFAVADAGCFVIVTNEGNGRMCSTLPPVHIALMGVERVVPSFRELAVMLPLLTGSATGQRASTYLNIVGGPRRQGSVVGPEEVHVVVLDNGRSDLLGTSYRSILHCIRCGACQNVCPVYRVVGGHGYGSVYGGPIGAVLTPLLVGFDRAGDLPHASSLCGACTEVCPVKIPLHEHLLALRADVAAQQAPVHERTTFRAWSEAWRRAVTYRWVAAAARLAQAPFARGRRIPRAPWPASRWTRGRDLPAVARRTFRERWRDRRGGRA
jgi:L-lactate dehydrogenase complex protein LldF